MYTHTHTYTYWMLFSACSICFWILWNINYSSRVVFWIFLESQQILLENYCSVLLVLLSQLANNYSPALRERILCPLTHLFNLFYNSLVHIWSLSRQYELWKLRNFSVYSWIDFRFRFGRMGWLGFQRNWT